MVGTTSSRSATSSPIWWSATAAARASLVLDIDELLDPFEMRRQRTTVGLARAIGLGLPGCRFACGTRLTESRLDIFQAELKLVGIELLGTSTEPMTHEGVDDRLQSLDLCVSLAFGESHIGKPPRLLQSERTKRFNVVG